MLPDVQPQAAAMQGAVDLAHLARQTMGDRALEQEVLSIFCRQLRLMMTRLEAATISKERFEIAHAIRGSAQGIGAWRTAKAAEALENAAQAGESADAALSGLAEAVTEVLAEIDGLATH